MAVVTGKVKAAGFSGIEEPAKSDWPGLPAGKWEVDAWAVVVDGEKGAKYLSIFATEDERATIRLTAAQARNLATKLTKGQVE